MFLTEIRSKGEKIVADGKQKLHRNLKTRLSDFFPGQHRSSRENFFPGHDNESGKLNVPGHKL